MKFTNLALAVLSLGMAHVAVAASLSNDVYRVTLADDGAVIVAGAGVSGRTFQPRFAVLCSEQDPQLELRWGDWNDGKADPLYNVLSWQPPGARAITNAAADPAKHVEDGFDPKSDQVAGKSRTQNLFAAVTPDSIAADKAQIRAGRIEWSFPERPDYSISAALELPAGKGEPVLRLNFNELPG